jgi:hypothetical protein
VLRREERGFSFSDPNVGVLHQFVALLYEALRGVPHRLRSQPHFGWKLRAPVEVSADVLGEVLPTPRAHIRPATERIGGKFHHAEAEPTGQALGNDLIRAVDEEQVTLVRSQGSGPRAFDVRQTTVGGLDDVAERSTDRISCTSPAWRGTSGRDTNTSRWFCARVRCSSSSGIDRKRRT